MMEKCQKVLILYKFYTHKLLSTYILYILTSITPILSYITSHHVCTVVFDVCVFMNVVTP